jgi:peptidoglycan-associated lipoprotein
VNRILLSLLVLLTLSACGTSGPVASLEDRNQPPAKAETAKTEATPATPTSAESGKVVETEPLASGTAGGNEVTGKSLEKGGAATEDMRKNPASPLYKRSIYFDFDSSAVKAEYQPLIEAHAAYLVAHKDARIVLQGNTDNRGSREYNLALGQRRAEAVLKQMEILGASDNQMEAISFGMEKPRALGDTEADFAENRRVDIVYKDEQ